MESKKISKYISINRPNDKEVSKQQIKEVTVNLIKTENQNLDVSIDLNNPMHQKKVLSKSLTCFAFLGPLIFTGYSDGLICEWQLENGQLNFPIVGHTDRVNSLLASTSDESIYSSSNDCSVR